MTDQGQRDLQAEQDHAEFLGWADAEGYDTQMGSYEDMREAFTVGMQAARDLGDWFGVGDADAGTLPAEPQSAAELAASMAETRRYRERLNAIRELCKAQISVTAGITGKGLAKRVIAIIDKPEAS